MPKQRAPERMIGALLRIPFEATVARIAEDYAAAGYADLRPPHFAVFQRLPPEGARATDLAEQSHLTKQYMGTLIDYLEVRGYVVREPDPTDRRASLVKWTERGQVVAALARESLGRLEDEWAARLGGDRLEELRGLLRDLTAIVEGQEEDE
jgi:DNA-binding MarR family transcriptional regulator